MVRLVVAALCVVASGASFAAADVTTQLDGSKLVVSGDDTPNALQIDAVPEGIRVLGTDGTLVDGSALGVVVPGVERLVVKLGRANDRLTIQDLTLAKKLDVRLGRGSDTLVMYGVQAGPTHVRSGNGDDWIEIDGPSRMKSLSIETSVGWDTVVIDDAWIPGDLYVDTGTDDDEVWIGDTEVGDDVDVKLGNDDDLLALADVSFDDDTHLDGENGDDALWLDGYVWFNDELDVDGFGDDDWWWWY